MYTIESIEEFAVKLREKAVKSDWQIREQNYGDIIEAINKLGVNRQTVEESLIGAVGVITQKYCSGYISASLSNAERDGVIMAATGVAAYAVCAKCGFENNNLIDIYRYKMADWSDNQEFIESVFRTAVKAANLTLASVESNVRKSNERIEENVRFNNTTDRTRNSINNEYVGSRENRVYEDGRADGQRAADGNGTVGAGEMEAGNGSSDKFTGEIRKTSFADTDSGEITAVVGNEAERNSDNISVGRTGEVRENPLGNNAGDGERGQRVSDGRYNSQNGIVGKISESSGNSGTERSKDGIIGNAEYKYIRDKKYIKGNTNEMLLLAERLKKESINFSGRINGDETTITVSGYEMRNRAEAYLSEIRSDLESENIATENKKLVDSFPMQDGLYPDRFLYNHDDNSFMWTYFNPDGDNGNGIFVEKRIDEQDIYAAYTAKKAAVNEAEGREAFLNYIFENCRESTIDIYSGYFADYAEDYINKPETVEEYYGIGANSTHMEDITALISRLEDSCAEIKSLTADSDGIVIDGREGTWYVIDTQTIGGKELFLLESENYGDEAACLIVDENRNILMDEVYNGFEDYIEANIVPEGQMIISGEVASEMWYYGFDVYVNGEKLGKYDDVSDKNGIFGRLEDKENTITAAVDDVTLYHTAETIATAVFDISKKYFNAERSISVPYYLNLEKYHEDNDWENWRKDENEYANTMWALLDNNYSSVENYLNNVISDSEVRDNMAEDREAALKAMQTIDVFKAEMEEYRPAENRVTVLPAEEKSYAEQLYTRVNDEYSYFIGQIKKESPEVLIQSAAEIVDKERIVLYLEEYSPTISDEQYEALLSRENPLDEIYEQWVQNGELSSFEDVGIALEETADRILISLDRENSRSEEKVNAVLAVSQNDTSRYYAASSVFVDDVRKAIASSDKLFTDLCALGEKQITEAQFAEYSQRNGVTAVDVDIDEQSMHVYGAEKPIVSFDEIKADFDEIAKALDLKNNTITFSVVTIEGEKPVVIGSYIDEDDITALEEYQDYIYDTGRKNIDVTVDYYTIGMGDNESYGADTDEKDYISEHLDEVLKSKYTDRLESETYFIATPAELLEEISGEEEKNYLFTVAEFEDGSRYVIPGEVGDDNIKDTAAWQEVKRNNFDIDNVTDLDEDIRVTYTVYQTGIGEAVVPTAEEASEIEASLDEILSDAVVVDTDNSSVRPWEDVDDVIFSMEKVWKERHEKEKNVSDGFDNSNFLYPNNLMRTAHDSEGNDRYNFDDAILQIKLAGSEWLRPVDAVVEMNRRGVDINDIEMLNVRYVSSDGTVGEKDVTPEQYMVYLAHSEERTNAFLAAVNAAEERKKVPENIMKIIRDDMPSFVKSAVAWDELMEYDGISEKFDKGENPVEVVKSYLANNGTFSWNADELKDGYFDWTVKDNGDTAEIFVSVNDSDTFRERYNSHFEVPWTEIADAFKQRIEQEKNYNKISDGTITVTAVGEDKFKFVDRSSNIEAIESREQLIERFAKMFNKAELGSIINSVIGNAEYEEQSEPEKETPVEKSNSSTLIVNIYGGPGAGKSTTALQLAAELKKRGYHAEYIPEVAKDYVYAKNFDMLDGSLEHQKQIFAEQKQRVDLMIGNVDVAITDAPLTLNTIYMAPNEITPEYAAHILDEYNSYNNYNIYIDRDLSVEFEQEGRIQNLSESIEKDGEIKSMLISNDIAFDEFDRNNITGIADRVSSSLEHLKKIEQTKSKMKEMGIPYSDKPFNSTEKEDIYAYDGSMSLEDFRKRQLLNSESVDENANSPVGNLGGDEDKQIIDLSKLSKITLNDEYERGTDQPDDFRYIKNTITFSDLNSSFLIRRNKEFTYDYDVLPDLDEGDTFITRQGMLKEVQDFLEAAKNDPDKSISITDMNGNTTVLKGSQYVFEATEDRLAFVIPGVGYAEISQLDDGSSDYAFYDNDFNITDRGMYNDMDVTLRQALTFILKDAGYDINNCTQMDFEELRSRIEEKSKKAMENGTYISPEERTEQGNTPKYEIYQIPAGERYHDIRFTSYEYLGKMGQLPDRFNYEKVYSGSLDEIEYDDKLEGIYIKFNTERPEDFAGHSLSTSDVIVIEDEKGKSAHFVDDVGFRDITDIFLELDRTQSKPLEEVNSIVNEAEYLDTVELEWKVLPESIDEETGKPSTWFAEINSERYGRYLWISRNENNTYDVEYDAGNEIVPVSSESIGIYSLSAAQDWVDDELADYINDKAIELNSESEPTRKKSGSEIEVGDKFLYNDREYTVTSKKGIYPDDVGVSYEDTAGGRAYVVTSNIDRYKLAENGVFLGNPEKERQTENSPVGNYENADGYEPKIGDLIEYQEKIFKVADVGSRFVTLQTADTLLPETTVVPVTELITSDSLTVIEENVKPDPVAETAEQPAEDKPKAQNYVITDDDFGVAGGAKTRYADNVAAIKTLKEIEVENRTATPEEQQILAKYTGWGAIPQAFDPSNEKWSNEFAQLKELLTETEYYSARSSTLNAHYTSTKVITAIYTALENFGFDGGKILEPAMGTGNFFGAMPERISANSQLYGVELDSITGRIAQQLYPKADISVCGYEQTSFEKESFDVAVGNVPFGAYKVNDAEYNKQNMFIHDYFFAKTLDKVRPGGIVAFVTSKGTMDKADESVRKYLAERAELIGAIRLPNTAFKATAGTEVTSDIIFLQKREEIVPNVDEEWIHTGNNPDGLPLNSYFIQHPEMIMGKIVSGNKLYGGGNDDTMCVPIEGENLAERLSEAVKQLKAVYTPTVKSEKEEVREAVSASGVNCYSFAVVDGELYFRENSSVMYAADLKGKAKDRAITMVEMRDKLNEIFEMQLKNGSGILSGQIEAAQQQLSDMYDRFVDEFGRIADKANKKVFDTDNSYYMLKSLEKYDDNGEYVGKADIFNKMTIKPKAIISHTDRPEDALILSIAEKAKVDLKFMSAISGMTEENLISELKGKMYQNPEKNMQWETADEYLSGNILKKIAAAEAAGMMENAEALRAVMPEPVEASDIKVRLGATWIPASDVKDFIIDVLNISYYDSRNLEVTYSEEGDKWKIEGWRSKYYNSNVREIYGTPDITAYEIIEACLNMKQVSIKSNVVDENGHTVLDDKGKPVKAFDADKTTLAQQKQEDIKRKFEDWIFENTERRERLTAVYNEKFNAVRLREFYGSHLQFTGMNPEITLREHQKNAIARGLFSGNTLLAHEVGAGKTFEMCAIAMEGKRLGLHNKAMIAVPNQLTEQIGEDFRKLYPSAKILVAQKKDFQSPAARKAFTAKIATGNWDGIIIGHSQFERLRLSPEREAKYIQDELDKLREALENCTDKKSFTVKQIERSIKAKEAKLEKILSEAPKDTMIEFEKLGIDKLFIDEAHMYKNLDTPTKMNRVAGLGSSGSTRAMSTLMKCKYMDELTGGKGVIFSTGTPISNSLAEMYTMQRYLQADKLKEAGIDSFDRWASTFGEVVTQMELKPESNGQYQNKSRFCNFINLPELVKMFKECADVKTADTLNLPRPEAEVHNVVTKPTSVQRGMIENLGKRATAIRSGAVQPWEDNMLKITSDGRKIGLDQRVMDSSLPDDPNSKVNTCVDNVYDIWVKNSDKKSTQLIFCDLSTPKNLKNPNHYYIFKQDGDSYVNAYEAKLTPDTDAEAIRQKFSSDKTLPKDFNMDKLTSGDVIVTKIVDSEEGIAEYTAYTVKSGELVEAPDDIYEKLGISHYETEGKGFSVYDDIKEKLIAKGIPEKEIAFIHDYDTAEEKQELFNKMNSGEIRVMLGSTFKCGAGVNVQKRLIALHDLDCPMRPSDMDQRHGRIIRQGNDNAKVDIYRYTTDKTFDAYMYQMLENKQGFIGKIMTSKTPERVCSDIDEIALDYAEMKALCAGNPLIKRKIDLEAGIHKLEVIKDGFKRQRYSLQKKAEVELPAKIEGRERYLQKISRDIAATKLSEKIVDSEGKEFYPLKVNGVACESREASGQALKNCIQKHRSEIIEGKTVCVGEYRGFVVSAYLNTLSENQKIMFELKGSGSYTGELNTDADAKVFGNLIRMDNVIDSMQKTMETAEKELAAMKADLENTRAELSTDFPQEAELAAMRSELIEVDQKLMTAQGNTFNTDIYESLEELFPDIMSGKRDYIAYTAGEAFDKLSVERQGDTVIVAHTYTQNGDLMYDPCVTFEIDTQACTATATSFENSGMGVYEVYSEKNTAARQSCEEFCCQTWFNNIRLQGYSEVGGSTLGDTCSDMEEWSEQCEADKYSMVKKGEAR